MNKMLKESLIVLGVLVLLTAGFMVFDGHTNEKREADIKAKMEAYEDEISNMQVELDKKEAEIDQLKEENDNMSDDKVKELEKEIKDLKEWKRTRQQYINYLYKELYK